MKTQNTIREWAREDRPREKLLALGAQNLSNSELLAILIHKGTIKKSAVDISKEILKLGDDNLNELAKLSMHELMQVKGIGEAKAVAICAALELGRRRQTESLPVRSVVNGSRQIGEFLQVKFKDHLHEVFAIVLLNQRNKIIHFEIISTGGITGTVADPRLIIKIALAKNAANIILCHNHPSGDLSPSSADAFLTKKIKEAAALLDIKVVDHIIVSDTGYYSFADSGIL